MVSQITAGSAVDDKGRPFRRRRPRPAIIAAVVLLLAGMAVWVVALKDTGPAGRPIDCNQPTAATASESESAEPAGAPTAAAAAPPTLTSVSRDEMLKVTPAALSTFQVRVLNASSQRGAARSVSDDLTAQGFAPVPDTPYADDPVYPNSDLACVAQIRFGPAGQAGAASVWVAIPCAQLIDDGRRGTSVDVALGEYYEAREQSQDQQATLAALRSADPRNPQTGADPTLVAAVHAAPC